MRPALALFAAYLGVAAAVAVLTGRGAWAIVVHSLALGVVLAAYARSGRPAAEPFIRWLPLLLVPVLYAGLGTLVPGGGGFHDAAVIRWEEALFGTQPSQTLALALPSEALSEVLHLCYLSFYLIIYVPPLVLARARRWELFDETLFALTLAFTVCFAMFVAFPVQGPRYLWPPAAGVATGPVRGFVLGILERFSSRGTAFPSSHVAVAVAQSITALRLQPRLGVVVTALSAGLAAGAVYGGFHYGVDVLAGAAVGAVIALAAPAVRNALRARLV